MDDKFEKKHNPKWYRRNQKATALSEWIFGFYKSEILVLSLVIIVGVILVILYIHGFSFESAQDIFRAFFDKAKLWSWFF